MTKPRIVLFHATPVAMDPILSSMACLWPEAEAINLLDDGLSADRAKEGAELSPELSQRFVNFGKYGHAMGADGILVTCSAFGPAIETMADILPIPVLKPNEAMFKAALKAGNKIAMLATFAPAVPTMQQEFKQLATEQGSTATLDVYVVPDAIDALKGGDAETHNRLIGEAAPKFAAYDAIMLAHFSTSRAMQAVKAAVSVPVLSAPDAAVLAMKNLF
ncbi:MAG: arylsulfatase [Alphaproteobacteria bacterium]|nr:arylsulfatase [Alphaproteobacteria bacterium]